jgi:hypothetical protein
VATTPVGGNSVSALASRFVTPVAEGSDEAIGEIPAESSLEADESRCSCALILPLERLHVGKEAGRAGRSDLCQDGGTHGTAIGTGSVRADPWRE